MMDEEVTKRATRIFGLITLVLGVILIAVFLKTDSSQLSLKPVFNNLFTQADKPVRELPGYVLVTKVVDGDTIDVEIDGKTETIRFIGIDTPEVLDPHKPVQCFGREASSYSKQILTGQSVKLESDPAAGNRDKYNRLLRYVFLPDGTNVNQQLIAEGYAHEYDYDDQVYKYRVEFQAAEAEAKNAERGFWSANTCNGVTK